VTQQQKIKEEFYCTQERARASLAVGSIRLQYYLFIFRLYVEWTGTNL
jgi:hypothetical protein